MSPVSTNVRQLRPLDAHREPMAAGDFLAAARETTAVTNLMEDGLIMNEAMKSNQIATALPARIAGVLRANDIRHGCEEFGHLKRAVGNRNSDHLSHVVPKLKKEEIGLFVSKTRL